MTAPTRYELRTNDGRLVDIFYDVDSARRAFLALQIQGQESYVTVRQPRFWDDLDS